MPLLQTPRLRQAVRRPAHLWTVRPRTPAAGFFRVVNIPTPEWMKELLATPKAAAESHVSVPEPEPPETSVPEDVQNEIRELASQEAATVEVVPEDLEPTAEETEAEAEAELEAETEEQEPQEPQTPPRPPRRFEFSVEAATIKAFVAQLEHLVDEVRVHVTRDGWHVLAVDPAHVAMVDLRVDRIDGSERRDDVLGRIEGEVEFGLDLTKMKEVLRLAKKDDTVHIVVDLPDAEDKDRITVEVGHATRTIATIDTADLADPRVPALNLPAKVTMAAEDLLEAMKALESVTDHVRLSVTRDGLTVLGEGDVDKVSLDFRHGEQCEVEMTGDRHTSLFPLDYFQAFLKVVKAEQLVLRLGTDYPVRADWDGATKGTYLLAPRIEESE